MQLHGSNASCMWMNTGVKVCKLMQHPCLFVQDNEWMPRSNDGSSTANINRCCCCFHNGLLLLSSWPQPAFFGWRGGCALCKAAAFLARGRTLTEDEGRAACFGGRRVGAFCMAAATVARTTVICSWACVRTLREPLGDTQRTHVNEQIIKLSGTHNSDLFVGNF